MLFEESLLYEQSVQGRSGVDIEEVQLTQIQTGQPIREHIGLPEVSEPQVVRHFTRLSGQNYSIDTNFFPLGSCTMKHNPRINEKVARLSGFANIHPLQNDETVQGSLALMFELEKWLSTLTGMHKTTLNPSAGAHGELTGAMIIKKAHEAKGNPRKIILVPDSAHGTNPATAAMCGYTCKTIPSNKKGLVDLEAFNSAIETYGNDIAAFMLTNPNTCGLFEPNVKIISNKLHEIGAYFYCDGANFNAICGKVKPADIGVDVMQFNLHKTFSTPHGGGGPGSGPVSVCEELAAYLPVPYVTKLKDGPFKLITENKTSIGRIRTFQGQFGMFVRALTYMKSHGINGLTSASENAVLNANYILSHLQENYNAPFNKEKGVYCMHECLFSEKWQKEHGIGTNEIAKALLDNGIHPMTVYFPLVVNGAMLIEPTESEPKEVLDYFIQTMKNIAKEVQSENSKEKFSNSPSKTFRQKLDEVQAAKNPKVTYEML
ncbi:MAG: glycine dehydrogenase (aminomethyl-transferring) [Magnetococcales bacterium]|nr:glycine dehydrogenase (aminomethyl-transferring) [Magnetococcales bacterium]